MTISGGDKVVSVFRERDGLHLCRDFVGCDLHVVAPVPHVHDHVVLRADRHHVLAVGSESLKVDK